MPEVDIEGIIVKFPFEPYAIQIEYMRKIIDCLNGKSHALLESPTGTGKTLCLLSATLAWRAHRKFHTSNNITGATNSGTLPYKIYYTSRTHSQLNQVINELKNLEYAPRITILGSREQLCIHPKVIPISNAYVKQQACKVMRKDRSCNYYNKFELAKDKLTMIGNTSDKSGKLYDQVMDIEDLVAVGNLHQHCPYYLTRLLHGQAELIFAPYNYLIDASIRESEKLDLTNSIVIFDEGHNISSFCEETASIEIEPALLAGCINELQACIQLINSHPPLQPLSEPDIKGKHSKPPVNIDFCYSMLRGLFELENAIYEYPLDKNGIYIPTGTHRYNELYMLFKRTLQIDHTTIMGVVEHLKAVIDYCVDNIGALDASQANEHNINTPLSISSTKGMNLFSFRKKLQRVYATSPVHHPNFIMHIQSKTNNLQSNESRVLGYWCMQASPVINELLQQGVRNLIVTSGTLSPLSTFATELGANFTHTIENEHVISNSQISVHILKRGPSGLALNSSYKNRNTDGLIGETGNSIAQICELSPNGVLVFFPSYSNMEASINAWKRIKGANNMSIWDYITKRKFPVIEPRNKFDLPNAMSLFYKNASTGSVFFAVCRGKVSEGIDFSDYYGRTVIVTGIPFPALLDPKVAQKKEYLDHRKIQKSILSNQKGAGLPAITPPHKDMNAMGGDEWYTLEAIRAVNQAIGRIIRHKNDYGAIVFCDERFANQSIRSMLSKWIQPKIKVTTDFSEMENSLASFFQHAANAYPIATHQRQKLMKIANSPEIKDQGSAATSNLSHNIPNKVIQSSLSLVERKRINVSTAIDYKRELKTLPTFNSNKQHHSHSVVIPMTATKLIQSDAMVVAPRHKKRKFDQRSLFDANAEINAVTLHPPEISIDELKEISKSLTIAIGPDNCKVMYSHVEMYKRDKDQPKLFQNIAALFSPLNSPALLYRQFSLFLKQIERDNFIDYINKHHPS